jgi:hypothetical protein
VNPLSVFGQEIVVIIFTIRAAKRHVFMEALEAQSFHLETEVEAFTFGSSVVFRMPVRLNKLFLLTH